MAAAGGAQITTVVTVPTRTTRGATTGTVAIGSDSRGGGNNSAPITFFDAIILRARLYENSKLQAGQARRTVLSNQRAALLSATYRSGVTDAAASPQPSFSARSRIVAARITNGIISCRWRLGYSNAM